jgi:hypothetical protein
MMFEEYGNVLLAFWNPSRLNVVTTSDHPDGGYRRREPAISALYLPRQMRAKDPASTLRRVCVRGGDNERPRQGPAYVIMCNLRNSSTGGNRPAGRDKTHQPNRGKGRLALSRPLL